MEIQFAGSETEQQASLLSKRTAMLCVVRAFVASVISLAFSVPGVDDIAVLADAVKGNSTCLNIAVTFTPSKF